MAWENQGLCIIVRQVNDASCFYKGVCLLYLFPKVFFLFSPNHDLPTSTSICLADVKAYFHI